MGAMRGFLEQFTTKNISVVKNLLTSAFTPVGYPGRVGHGIIRPPITVVPHPKLAKDVSYVAAPAPHRACAGRNSSCGPRGLSQRPSLSDVSGGPGHNLSGRGLCLAVCAYRATRVHPVALSARDDHAVSGKPRGSPGGRGRPGAYRLEVSAGSRADRSGVRLFGPERIPGPPAGRQCRSTAPRQAAKA